MSIPDPTQPAASSGWYPTGETGPDGLPVERWWDGAAWSAMVRPLGGGTGIGPGGGRRKSAARSLIAAAVVIVLVGGGLGAYFALHKSNTSNTASTSSQPTPNSGPTGNGGFGGGGGTNGGLGGGGGEGGGGSTSTPSPEPTVTGGSGQTVSDPYDALTIPVPSGWTGSSGSTSGEGTWPTLSTGPYTCPAALASSNGGSSGSSAAEECTRGGVNFATTSGSAAQSVATSTIADLAKGNYGTLSSHKVVSQGAITVAGRAGYQVTWSVVPDYTGPGGTVEGIALPVPGETGYFTLIDIGVDNSSQAPSLSSVNSGIIQGITDSSAAGA
jgi:hypothetical protein